MTELSTLFIIAGFKQTQMCSGEAISFKQMVLD